MKILLISPFFFPANRFQQELYRHLLAAQPEVSLTVVCYQVSPGPKSGLFDRKVPYVRIHCISLLKDQFVVPNYWQLFSTLFRLNRKEKFDVITCETRFFESSWWLPFLAKLWGVPAVIVDHCAGAPRHHSRLVEKTGKFLDQTLIKFCLNQYSVVCVSTRATANYLRSLGVRRVRVISTGVDPKTFRPGRKSVDEQTEITFVGRLVASKGPLVFLETAKDLLTRYPRLRFAIAGYGDLYPRLRQLISRDGLEKNIRLTGTLSEKQVAKLLGNTDIFVLPTSHHEGIPNTILEAGAAGAAVITTKAGGIGEIIKNNQTGLVLKQPSTKNAADAVEDLLTNTKKRLRLSEALYSKVVSQYRWANVAQVFWKTLSDLAN